MPWTAAGLGDRLFFLTQLRCSPGSGLLMVPQVVWVILAVSVTLCHYIYPFRAVTPMTREAC